MGRLCTAAATCVVLMALAAPAHAAPVAFGVPVTQPDELGRSIVLDTDVYLPPGEPPATGWPLVMVFHGGGSDKSNAFDAGHAAGFAAHGYAAILYSARGHGASGGLVSVAGPHEIADLFDVMAWAFATGGRDAPAHASFRLDRSRIAFAGYSQGGLHTNLGEVWAHDRTLNPYGFEIAAILPGNTPDRTFDALVDHEAVKLSFGIGLLGTYFVGSQARVAPRVDGWIATALLDQSSLYGGASCDLTGHDSPSGTMRADLAARSPACQIERMTAPVHWAQAFDDSLFTPDMAIRMWREMPATTKRLYLSMGGHAAPSATDAVEGEKFRDQIAFLDHVLRGAPLRLPNVTYWTRDPAVHAPVGTGRYTDKAWYRQTSVTWPPAGTRTERLALSGDGQAIATAKATGADIELTAASADPANDPALQAAANAVPGLSAIAAGLPPLSGPGAVASFVTIPSARDRELAGAPVVHVSWTPLSTDTQVALRVFDRAPDGTLTLLSRGVQGLRGRAVGQATDVTVSANTFSALIHRGHALVAWLSAGDATFYKPYPGTLGGVLHAGPAATLDLPLRDPSAGPTCVDRLAPHATLVAAGVLLARGGVVVRGRARDRGCGGRVRRVDVAIARRAGGRCRYLRINGRLGRPASCGRRVWLRAQGTTRWHLRLTGRLMPGHYVVRLRATDRAGNREGSGRGGRVLKGRVR
jgi:ABC-2 type transport system ATP-binding protein